MGLYVHTYLDKQKEDFIMSDAKIQQFSEKLKALSHPQRLSIVEGLMQQPSNVTSIQQHLGIPQPSVSAHLAKLKNAGIIQGQRQGQEISYSLVDEDTRNLLNLMH